MFRFAWLMGLLMVAAATMQAADSPVNLTAIDRIIRKQPAYKSDPHYALLVVGPRAEHRAWLVIDGTDVAYVDRNGNGDLTDDGERIEVDRKTTDKINVASSHGVVGMNVFPLGKVAGCELTFQLWLRDPAYDLDHDETLRDHPEFRRAQQDMRDLRLQNGSLLRTAAKGMQAQIPLALTTKPEDAQICHLLGPISFALKWNDAQRLEPWPKRTVFDINLGTRGLPPKGWTHAGFDFAPLTTSEVPETIHPVAAIEYPDGPQGQPKSQKLTLNERCCGDTFYASFSLPKGATAGDAKVTLSIPRWLGHKIETIEFNVPINQERSKTNEFAYVLFNDPQIELKHAVNVLRKARLSVTITGDALVVASAKDQPIGVRLLRDSEVQTVAQDLGEGTSFADDIAHCDARFEIGPHQADNEAAINQIESLLQELTAGYLYHTWDKQLSR